MYKQTITTYIHEQSALDLLTFLEVSIHNKGIPANSTLPNIIKTISNNFRYRTKP